MKETYEFRIFEEYASLVLQEQEGIKLGPVRKINVYTDDPLFVKIGDIHKRLRTEGKYLFSFYHPTRHYTSIELEKAELFQLKITSVFEPTGEECGTLYDESSVCPYCKSGRKQISDLILDLRKIPKNKDIAKTLADDEIIVNQRLADLLIENKVKGFELHPVKHKSYYREDPIDPTKLKTGIELLKKAEEAGIIYHSWTYYVWLNQPAQASLYQKMVDEYVSLKNNTSQKEMLSLPKWYQLVVKSKPVKIASATRFGIDPFDEDNEGKYRCPNGHIIGFKILSELSVEKDSWDGSDINLTESMIGCRQGVYVPAPLITISKWLYNLLKDNNIKGFETEVAYLWQCL